MDLDDLRTFVLTARHGSFSAAARELSLSQPAVSRRMQRLEEEVGAKLLDRSAAVVSPTRQGLEFLQFAEEVLKNFEAVRPKLESGDSIEGVLQIAASTTPGECILPHLLASFLEKHPQIQANLNVMDSDTVEGCVEARHCDIGFLGRLPRRQSLFRWQFAEDEIVLAVPARHRFAQRGRIRVEELEGEAFVEREEGSATRETIERFFQQCGRTLPPHSTVMQCSSVQAQLAAVAAGHGVGFVSRLALERYAEGRIAAVRLDGQTLLRGLYMIFDERRHDPACRTFIRFVRERCGGTPS